jgi:mono/diheme cytochrome c family protein
MARWIDTVEPAKPSDDIDESAIARGASIFYSDEANCASCHSGGFFTNNQTVDVGTGLELQVPPLVGLDGRGRYMHDGCAETLMDRFTDEACGGGDQHGKTSHLSGDELGDLVSFLRTL